ncbi:acyl-CoA/acyl-ACP dehydrogenase [Bradyrhizobium tropiciagri]|uniref:acyl-CoA dehydrogenase family protein n=1 Tax=Bradyrhizobium tropiciagri TaxID=312253 RepID=UPI001BA5396D|nr:acyl-CoA dehydrogenase family protein [Bradyrhizobium tropiciagri]MBR0899037.1 acyl-CoA/acyl-ACP dehydrogenase [Bradyrhizobium tropiciagri]
MDFSLNEEHEALRDNARAFLSKEAELSKLLVPGATVAQAGYDGMWNKMVELGWPGIVVPEAYGGLGMTYLDLAMVMGEIGRSLAAAPLFGTLAGAWAVEKAGSEDQKKLLLGEVAAGRLRLALAVTCANGTADGAHSDVKAVQRDGRWVVSGRNAFVVDADAADKIVVLARTKDKGQFFLVDRGDRNVTVDVLEWRDITRQVCAVSYNNVSAEPLSQSDDDTWPWIRDRLYLVLAAESAGGIQKVLADTVEYAKERVAFGKPIGAFQAIKHQLAELAGLDQCATAGVHFAAWALGEGDKRASLAAAMAQSYASAAYRDVTYRNIQVFGAIGFTWEMKNHLYYKRARSNAELLGAPRHQRDQVVRLLEKTPELLSA